MNVAQVQALVDEVELLDQQMEQLDNQLAELKTRKLTIQRNLIPDLMMGEGVTQIKLDSGITVKVEQFVDAHIKNWVAASAWLIEHGHSNLIKTGIDLRLGRDERPKVKEIISFLQTLQVPAVVKETIHPQTLKAFVREQVEAGTPIPMDDFGVFIGNTTKIAKK